MLSARFALIALLLAAALLAPAAARADEIDEPKRPPFCMTTPLHHMSHIGAGPGAMVAFDRDVRGDRAAARRIAKMIRTRIYPRFKRLLGRTPPSDARERCYNGPDGRLDVYVTRDREIGDFLIPEGVRAFVHPFMSDRGCGPRKPVFALVSPNVRPAVLAHEIFHAFQAAYDVAEPCVRYGSWEEATATWAGDWVYPRDDVEHEQQEAFRYPRTPLSVQEYSAWVFARYLSEKLGPGVIRRIEEAKEEQPDTEHVDAAIPGGLRARLPEFAVYAWNQAPLPKVPGIGASFRAWDRLPHKVRAERMQLSLGGARAAQQEVKTKRMRILAREYRDVTVADGAIRRLTFVNPQAADPNVHVRALVQTADGRWAHENWDGRERVEYCRDVPEQDVRRIVLVLTRSSYQRGVVVTPRFELEDSCGLRFKILAARLSTSVVASGPDIYCGAQAGTKLFDGSTGEIAYDGTSFVRRDRDQLEGEIFGKVPATWHGHHLDGCRSPNRQACSVDMPDRKPGVDGTWEVGFSLSGRWDDPLWEVRWRHEQPEVGFVDAGDPECNVHIWGAHALDVNLRREPRETFLRTDPVTLTFAGSGRPVTNLDPDDATIDHQWSYSVTFQRVDAAGRPLG